MEPIPAGEDQGVRINVPRTRVAGAPSRKSTRLTGLIACSLGALIGASPAFAVDVDVPIPSTAAVRSAPPVSEAGATASPSQPAATAVPAPTPAPKAATTPVSLAAIPTAVGKTAAGASVLRALRPGMVGPDVRVLQQIISERGIKVSVDGAYGKGTINAVKRVQRGMHLARTGLADLAFLRKVGLHSRLAASVPAATTPAAAAATTATTAAKAGQYLKVFPVQGTYSYRADFGAARHQGSHQGVDIIAAEGTPLMAVANGVIERLTRTETGLGGIWIWLKDSAGNTYYYAHMSSIVDGLQAGSSVKAGQQIGAVGNTGDARYGESHLHFELHPGGSSAVDPFAELTTVDPNPNAASRSK